VIRHSRKPGQSGYTLLEVIVVLVLLTIAAALVAPSLLPGRANPSSPVSQLVASARAASVRRGEMIHLRIDRAGNWEARTGNASQPLMSGRLSDPPKGAVDLILSPLGTCASSVGSTPIETPTGLDPLTCEALES
jgi:prepilin-type N-terminal cleavage/methylation domain-containing protein